MEKLIIEGLNYHERDYYDDDCENNYEKIVDILTSIFELRADANGLSELTFRNVTVGNKYNYSERIENAERNQAPPPPMISDLF